MLSKACLDERRKLMNVVGLPVADLTLISVGLFCADGRLCDIWRRCYLFRWERGNMDIGLRAIPVDQAKRLLGRKLWPWTFLLQWWWLCSDHLVGTNMNGCGSRNSNRWMQWRWHQSADSNPGNSSRRNLLGRIFQTEPVAQNQQKWMFNVASCPKIRRNMGCLQTPSPGIRWSPSAYMYQWDKKQRSIYYIILSIVCICM